MKFTSFAEEKRVTRQKAERNKNNVPTLNDERVKDLKWRVEEIKRAIEMLSGDPEAFLYAQEVLALRLEMDQDELLNIYGVKS